jgi:hypothetical protein
VRTGELGVGFAAPGRSSGAEHAWISPADGGDDLRSRRRHAELADATAARRGSGGSLAAQN